MGAPAKARPTTLGALLRDAQGRFSAAGLATPALDARMLVGGILGLEARDLIVGTDDDVEAGAAIKFEAAVCRRLDGEPVHRILGSRPFFGLELKLSPATLEPRPDTEILVEAVLPFVARRVEGRGTCMIADMGTGTGAIGLALLSLSPSARCLGVDISQEALLTAAANARLNGLSDRFDVLHSDWYDAMTGKFDAIVANPPYIESHAIASLEREVRDHDPRIALDGGADGLEPYRILAAGARGHLSQEGIVGVEYGFRQAGAVEAIFETSGFRVVSRHRDLGGHDRASLFQPSDAGDPSMRAQGT